MANTNLQQYPEVTGGVNGFIQRDVDRQLSIIMQNSANLMQLIQMSGERARSNKFEWQDQLIAESSTSLTANIAIHAASAAGITIAVVNSGIFLVGDVIFVDGLQPAYQITAIPDGVSVTATEIRGVALGAAAGNGRKAKFTRGQLEITTTNNAKGADFGVMKNNFTQIFRRDMEVSHEMSRQAANGIFFGQANVYDSALQNALKDITHDLYNAVTRGVGLERTGTGVAGRMNGIRQYIDVAGGNVTDAAAAAIDAAKINTILSAIYDKVSDLSNLVLVMSAGQSRKLNALDAGLVRLNDQHQNSLVGRNISGFVSDISGAADIPIILDSNMDPAEIWILDRSKLSLVPFSDVAVVPSNTPGKTADSAYAIGTYTIMVRHGEEAHGIIKNLSI